MPHYILAHDLGTSGNKATLYTVDGELAAGAVVSYETRFFNANWAEQDPRLWWDAVCGATRQICTEIDPADIGAVSFSGQMMGCVCVDRHGEPLRDSIIWADQRSLAEMEVVRGQIPDHEFYRITGHRPSPAYSLEKLMWIKAHEPETYAQTYKMLHAKDYVVLKLTDQYVTEYSDASGTHVLDINTLEWSDRILAAAGVEADMLPALRPSIHVAGEVTRNAADATGLKPGTPVVCGAGDGVAAAVGSACVSEKVAHCYLGSSAWIGLATAKPVLDVEMRTVNWAHAVPGMISPNGPMQAAGNSFAWMQRELCLPESELAQASNVHPFSLINERIENSPPGANGLVFLPHLLGERSPRWNPNARGAFIGLKLEHRRDDVLRSVIEGVAFNLRFVLDVFRSQTSIDEMVLLGGGAKGRVERQIMADMFAMPVKIPTHLEEATSMGAAVIGGVGTGMLSGFAEIDRFLRIEEVIDPITENRRIYERMAPIVEKCYSGLVAAFDDLADLD